MMILRHRVTFDSTRKPRKQEAKVTQMCLPGQMTYLDEIIDPGMDMPSKKDARTVAHTEAESNIPIPRGPR